MNYDCCIAKKKIIRWTMRKMASIETSLFSVSITRLIDYFCLTDNWLLLYTIILSVLILDFCVEQKKSFTLVSFATLAYLFVNFAS